MNVSDTMYHEARELAEQGHYADDVRCILKTLYPHVPMECIKDAIARVRLTHEFPTRLEAAERGDLQGDETGPQSY